jgi:hypothetical protein
LDYTSITKRSAGWHLSGSLLSRYLGASVWLADDSGVGGRDQKDVWRLAKFFCLALAMTRGHTGLISVLSSLFKGAMYFVWVAWATQRRIVADNLRLLPGQAKRRLHD